MKHLKSLIPDRRIILGVLALWIAISFCTYTTSYAQSARDIERSITSGVCSGYTGYWKDNCGTIDSGTYDQGGTTYTITTLAKHNSAHTIRYVIANPGYTQNSPGTYPPENAFPLTITASVGRRDAVWTRPAYNTAVSRAVGLHLEYAITTNPGDAILGGMFRNNGRLTATLRLEGTAPPEPSLTEVVVSNITHNSATFTVSGDNLTGSEMIHLRYRQGVTTWAPVAPQTSLVFNIGNLRPESQYGVQAALNSAFSNAVSATFRTLAEDALPPVVPEVPTSPTLVTGSFGYSLQAQYTGTGIDPEWIETGINLTRLNEDGFIYQPDFSDIVASNRIYYDGTRLWMRAGVPTSTSLLIGRHPGAITDWSFGFDATSRVTIPASRFPGSYNAFVAEFEGLEVIENPGTNVHLMTFDSNNRLTIQPSGRMSTGTQGPTQQAAPLTLRPTSSGVVIGRTSSGTTGEGGCSGASNLYQCVDEASPNDADRIFMNQSADRLDLGFSPNLVNPASITSVVLHIRARNLPGGRFSGLQVTQRAGGQNVGSEVSMLNMTSSYADYSATLTTPSISQITGSSYGIRARTINGGTRISQAYIVVNYTQNAPGTISCPEADDFRLTRTPTRLSLEARESGGEYAHCMNSPANTSGNIRGGAVTFGGADVSLSRLRISGIAPGIDLTFDPDTMDETQQGASGNSWTWQGTLNDGATYSAARAHMANTQVELGSPLILQVDARGQAINPLEGLIIGLGTGKVQTELDGDNTTIEFVDDTIEEAADATGFSIQSIWLVIVAPLALLAALGAGRFLRSPEVAFIVVPIVFMVGAGFGSITGQAVILISVFSFGLYMATRAYKTGAM